MPPDAPARRRTGRRATLRPALIPLAAVAELASVGLSTVERMKAAGRIGPRPVDFGGPKYRYREVRAWLENPGPGGEPLTAFEWPAVWQQLRAEAAKRRR